MQETPRIKFQASFYVCMYVSLVCEFGNGTFVEQND